MILTYKYRIKDRSARKALLRHASAVNQVWNYCVEHQRLVESRWRSGGAGGRWPAQYDLQRLTRGSSTELGIHAQSIQNVCQQFTESRDAIRRSPRFRCSGGPRRSLGWVPFQRTSRQIEGNSVFYLGKRFRFWEGNRPVPASAKGGSFVEDARGRWYVCFHVEVGDHAQRGTAIIGIDLGIKNLAACSDGSMLEAPRIYRRNEQCLAASQRAKNKQRTRAIHAKIKNSRKDFIHKATTSLARNSALIAVGNINSAQMGKTRMAKSVFDAGWSMFRSQLRYKASRHGALYLEVDEKFTTQTCSSCGVIPHSSPKGMGTLGMRAWDCSACGVNHDRDVNAARNILALALSAQRRDDESRNRPAAAIRISTRAAIHLDLDPVAPRD